MIPRLASLALADAALLALPSREIALMLHVALTLIAGATWIRRGPLVVAPAMLGVAGSGRADGRDRVGTAVAVARAPRRRRAPPPTPAQTPRIGVGRLAKRWLDGRVRHPASAEVGSLVTILRHGDVPMRRAALETVVRSFEPALSPLIAQALADPDQTIRALAAAAAARIAANLAATRATLEAAVEADEPGRAAARLARAPEGQAR
ncbi:hypothetical protein AB5I41_06890 [Sphingomonas sp. MMS24-JH45]